MAKSITKCPGFHLLHLTSAGSGPAKCERPPACCGPPWLLRVRPLRGARRLKANNRKRAAKEAGDEATRGAQRKRKRSTQCTSRMLSTRVPGGPALTGRAQITTYGSSMGVVKRRPQEGASRRVVKSRPCLDDPSHGTLDDSSGGEQISVLGPDLPHGPPRVDGTWTVEVPASKCANLIKFRQRPTKKRHARHEKATPWSALGETWSKLHSLM